MQPFVRVPEEILSGWIPGTHGFLPGWLGLGVGIHGPHRVLPMACGIGTSRDPFCRDLAGSLCKGLTGHHLCCPLYMDLTRLPMQGPQALPCVWSSRARYPVTS